MSEIKKKAPAAKKETLAKVDPSLGVISSSPIFKAMYIERKDSAWHVITVELQDDQVISKTTKECMNKAHALEDFKLSFVKNYFIGK